MSKSEKLATLLAKLKRGENLTAPERKFVDAAQRPATHFERLEDVAVHYGVTRPALDRWRDKYPQAFIQTAKGYDAAAIAEARKMYLATGTNTRLNKGDEGADGDTLAAVKLRKENLGCDKLLIQIEILRGKYALVDDVMSMLMPIVYAFKDRLLKLGPEVSYQLSGMEPADIEDKLRSECEKILNKLADEDIPRLKEKLGEPKDGGDELERMPAARETNGRQKAS